MNLLPTMARFEALGAESWSQVDTHVRRNIQNWFILSPGGLPVPPASRTLMLGDSDPGIGLAGRFLYDAAGPQSILKDVYPVIGVGRSLIIDLKPTPIVPQYPPLVSGDAAGLGGDPFLPFTFYDTHSLASPGLYLPGHRCEAAVASIALRARRVDTKQYEIATPAWMQALAPEERPDGPTVTLDLSRLAAWLPSDTYADMARFHGEVLHIEEIGCTPFGSPAIACDVVVSRDPTDIVLRVVIADAVWSGERAQVGDQIEGAGWVQGRVVHRLGRWAVMHGNYEKRYYPDR